MTMLHAWLALSIVASPSTETVVVVTEPNATLFERMARVQDWDAALDANVLDATELQRRLSGLANPQTPTAADTSKVLARAAECEAAFDPECASRLRYSVVDAYDNAVLPDRELQVLAAAALHDLSGAELVEGRRDPALALARTALRRFPNVPLDTRRHAPPIVQLFVRAATEQRQATTTTVTFRSTRAGRLFIDGLDAVTIGEAVTRKLVQGVYRVWIGDDRATSLVHTLTVTSATQTVDIDFALEAALSWKPVPILACAQACDERLAALARASGVGQAAGLRLDDRRAPAVARVVTTGEGLPQSRPIMAMANLDLSPELVVTQPPVQAPPTRSHFSAWSLVPFGVGQFAQGRYIAGTTYAAIEAGLLAWHIVAVSRANGYDGPSIAANDDRRAQRNLSAALLAGALVANVVEAIVVDAVSN